MLASVRSVTLACAIIIPSLLTHEGMVLEPYDDIAGIRTYCVGETENVEERKYTKSECIVRLAQRVSRDYEAPIAKCTKTWKELPVEAKAAAVSLAYNIGVGAYCKKSSVRRYFDKREFAIGCQKFLLWDKSRVNGRLKTVQGLVNRRTDEMNLCMEGVKRQGLG